MVYLCFLRTCIAKAWRVGHDLSQKLQLIWIPERCLLSRCCFTLVDQLDWNSHKRQRQFPSESLVIFWLTISSISIKKLQNKGQLLMLVLEVFVKITHRRETCSTEIAENSGNYMVHFYMIVYVGCFFIEVVTLKTFPNFTIIFSLNLYRLWFNNGLSLLNI